MFGESIRGAEIGGTPRLVTEQSEWGSWENKVLWGVGLTADGLRIPILLVQEFRQYALEGGGRSPALEVGRRLELWDGTVVLPDPPEGQASTVSGFSSSNREFKLGVEKPTAARKVPG